MSEEPIRNMIACLADYKGRTASEKIEITVKIRLEDGAATLDVSKNHVFEALREADRINFYDSESGELYFMIYVRGKVEEGDFVSLEPIGGNGE